MRTALNKWTVGLALAVASIGVGASSVAAQTQTAPPPASQGGSGPHEGFGIQAIGGPVFANLTDAQGFDTSNKTGFLVGVALGGNRGGVLGVEADVLYGQKGAKETSGSISNDFKQNVIDVPVMLKANFGSGNVNGLSVFVQGGGFFDWQFNSKLNDVDVSSNTDGYEVGYVLGGGVEVLRFSVQARYYRGLKEINKTLQSASDAKSQAVAVLFAFRLN